MRTRIYAVLFLALAVTSTAFGQQPTPEAALQYRPAQKDVDYDLVAVADLKKCRVELETIEVKNEKRFGFAVFDPNGLILRRYLDLNGDRYIDVWRYYKNGIECYRDLDTNFNQKPDQCRWVNIGGSRWGVDKDEDGKIDTWKQLSAEEATRVAISAMAAGDAQLFSSVLITKEDCADLALSADVTTEMLRQVQDPAPAIRAVMNSQTILGSGSKWTRMDAAMPGSVPSEDGKSKYDITVYENVMAFVENNKQHGIVQIGEMVQVGNVWKLTQIPKPVTGDIVTVATGGLLMRPGTQSPNLTNELSPKMQELLKRLQEIDGAQPGPNAEKAVVIKFYADRKSVVSELVKESTTEQQRDLWLQQLINQLMSEAQFGDKAGIQGLVDLETTIRKQAPKSPLIPYIIFRRGFLEYSLKMQAAADPKAQQAANDDWMKWLEDFVKQHPDSSDSIDATIQLAVNSELSADLKTARKWYQLLIGRMDNEAARERGRGALRRLDLPGQKIVLSGADINGKPLDINNYKGKVTLVVFWSMLSQEFAGDVPVLRALHEQYKSRGFDILGVCLDADPKQIAAYSLQNKLPWDSIHDAPNGKNPLSLYYAIPSPAHYFLVDKDGLVISTDIKINALKDMLAKGAQAPKK